MAHSLDRQMEQHFSRSERVGIESAFPCAEEQWRLMVLMLLFFSYIYVLISSMDGKGNAMRGQPTTNSFYTKVACLLSC